MEHLLIMHYDQKLEDGERFHLEQWISQNEANKKRYEDTVFIWKQAKFLAINRYINTEREWEKLSNIIRGRQR